MRGLDRNRRHPVILPIPTDLLQQAACHIEKLLLSEVWRLPVRHRHLLGTSGTEGTEGTQPERLHPPAECHASVKPAADTRLERDDSVNIPFVSGNPLPSLHSTNIKSTNRDCYGDRHHGQTASKTAAKSKIYGIANSPALEGAFARNRRHRWRLLSAKGRATPPHPGTSERRTGDAGPLAIGLTGGQP